MPESIGNLEIWKQAVKLVKTVYSFPMPGSLMSSSVWSPRGSVRPCLVPANIVQSVGRGSRREIARFGRVALGSLYELDTLLVMATQLGYRAEADLRKLQTEIATLAKGISNFVRYQKIRT